jgi:hypothetical protein
VSDVDGVIPFLVADEGDEDDTKGIFHGLNAELYRKSLPTAELRENLDHVVGQLRHMIANVVKDEDSPLILDQLQVNLEVSAKAGFSVIGTSEVAGKAAITLVFARR